MQFDRNYTSNPEKDHFYFYLKFLFRRHVNSTLSDIEIPTKNPNYKS